MKLHITPRQNVYTALSKLTKSQQHDLREGIKNVIGDAYKAGAVQWNNDITLDLDFIITGNRYVTVLVWLMLNAEDGDIHCRIDHLLIHKDRKAADEFAGSRENGKGTFTKIL